MEILHSLLPEKEEAKLQTRKQNTADGENFVRWLEYGGTL